MSRARTAYECSACGWRTAQFLGRCAQCGAWGSLTEQQTAPVRAAAGPRAAAVEVARLPDVDLSAEQRHRTGLPELDQVLGGGLVPGSVVLLGGEPGVGKSTLMLQAAAGLVRQGLRVGYVCGEESPRQVRLRARRLGLDHADVLLFSGETLQPVLAAAEEAAVDFLVIDSIQTVAVEGVEGRTGGPAHLTESAAVVVGWAKRTGTAVVLTGHVTKAGDLAGPRVVEHLVDVVLYFEGGESGVLRILRATKNRFGATDEVGVFEMTGAGLRSVENLGDVLLATRDPAASGSAVTAVLEGSRTLVVEIQALAVPSTLAVPRRIAAGIEVARLHLVLAVLARRAGIGAGNLDVVVSTSGALRVRDAGADLALAVAVASAVRDRALAPDLAFLGEVALSGALRTVPQLERRLHELRRLGFRRCVVPPGVESESGVRLLHARTLRQALEAALAG